jgi:hypothetical protein
VATLKQSTAYTRMFLMVDAADHISAKTGLTVTVTLSKAGGSFAAAGGTVTEVANGWYKIALTTTDTNTLGDLAYHCTGTGADPTDFEDQVSARALDDLAYPATSGRSLGVNATGQVGLDFNNINDAGSAHTLTNITVPSLTTAVNLTTNNDKTGYSLSASGIDGVLDRADGVETGFTLRQAMRLILSAAAAKLSGAATTTVAIRDVNDSKDRISATVDANGNRTAVTLNVS